MMRFSASIVLISSLIACMADEENGGLVVDSLDMSSNDFTVQITYKGQVEIFQNEPYIISIGPSLFCGNPYVRKRVLPKNGNLEITENQIKYQPLQNFHGLDSIQYEMCCEDKCNVFSERIRVWQNIEEKCAYEFSILPEVFYHTYSRGQVASTRIEIGISPPSNCEQYVQAIEIIREPMFGSISIIDKKLWYKGDLPQNSADTVIFVGKITIDSQAFDKQRTWVIHRIN
jgi:hypothetical protein